MVVFCQIDRVSGCFGVIWTVSVLLVALWDWLGGCSTAALPPHARTHALAVLRLREGVAEAAARRALVRVHLRVPRRRAHHRSNLTSAFFYVRSKCVTHFLDVTF